MDRVILRRSLLLTLVMLTLSTVFIAWSPAASAASSDSSGTATAIAGAQKRDPVVRFGEDVTIAETETYRGLVVFGGDIDVQGTVEGPVVAFGGDVRVAGTVTEEVVAFGGRVVLESTARVGTTLDAGEDGVIAFGGDVSQAPGAEVSGNVREISGVDFGSVLTWLTTTGAVAPIRELFSFGGWVVMTLAFLVLGLVAAALLPNQIRAVERHLAARPAASLGWGALTFFVIAPLIIVALVISIVGILVLIPGLPTLLLAYFFAVVSVGAFIAERFVTWRVSERNQLFVAMALGVVATSIVSVVPVLGGLLILAMMLFGTGAALLAFGDWRRRRKAATAAVPPGSPVPPGATPPPGGGAPPYHPASQSWPTGFSSAPAGEWPQPAPPQAPQPAAAWPQQPGPPAGAWPQQTAASGSAWPQQSAPAGAAWPQQSASPAPLRTGPSEATPPAAIHGTPPQDAVAGETNAEGVAVSPVEGQTAVGEAPRDEAPRADTSGDPGEEPGTPAS